MNNKGFAVSSIIYAILIIFLILIFSVLSLLVTRGNTLGKIKNNAVMAVKGINDTDVSMDALVADFTTMNITSDASAHGEIDYNLNVYSPYDYVVNHSISSNKITYTAYNGTTQVMSLQRNLNRNANPKVDTYEYKGEKEEIFLSPGLYKIEVWGAKTSSKGSYSVGFLYVRTNTLVYAYVGGQNIGSAYGFNNGTTHIAYKDDYFANLNDSNVLISAGSRNVTSGVSDGSVQTNVNSGNGLIKITSLIYFTK